MDQSQAVSVPEAPATWSATGARLELLLVENGSGSRLPSGGGLRNDTDTVLVVPGMV